MASQSPAWVNTKVKNIGRQMRPAWFANLVQRPEGRLKVIPRPRGCVAPDDESLIPHRFTGSVMLMTTKRLPTMSGSISVT